MTARKTNPAVANADRFANVVSAWSRLDTVEKAKTNAVKKVTTAYELIAETLIEVAQSEGIKTASATDLFLHSARIAVLGDAVDDTAFSRRWERAVKVAYAVEGTPFVVSSTRKAAVEKAKAMHYGKAAEALEKAGVEKDAARKAVLAAVAADKSGILVLNLLKVVEAFNNGQVVVRIKPEPEAKPAKVATTAPKVVGKIAPTPATRTPRAKAA